MAIEKTETHTIQRGGGDVTVSITATPRQGGPIKLYRLLIDVVNAVNCSPFIFVYQRATVGAPMEDGSPRDEFVCVADALDEDEIPVNEPDMARNVPYYRVRTVELLFRNSDMMYETMHSIIGSIKS